MRNALLGILAVLIAAPSLAQTPRKQDPVSWKLQLESNAEPGARLLARLTASIEDGWHLYSPTTPPGPIPTEIKIIPNPAVASYRLYQPEPKRKLDPNFGNESQSFDREAVFLFDLQLAADAAPRETEITAQVRYQVCSDTVCLRPVRKSASAKFHVARGATSTPVEIPAGYSEVLLLPAALPVQSAAPTSQSSASVPATRQSSSQGFGNFLLLAFGFGLAAIFTPCVFPMIPITMSYFLNSGGSAVKNAAIFCLGIVVLFTGLGLATTAALGPFGVVQLGSNPWVNGFIALIFTGFALSLMGAYEITLPSGLLTKLNAASQSGGIAGTLIMGLTFALTSFACVGPFMGTLLAASVQGDRLQPVAGMAAFASGLASPFFFLALFPGYLKRMPKSGGWMSRVKMVLGFVVLAAALKYLSNVDEVMHWGILTRERFLAVWIVLLAMPGFYVLGMLRMEGVTRDDQVGVARALIGALLLVFSVSLIPGMWGARLGELDAYVPAAKNPLIGSAAESKLKWLKDDYAGALAQAKVENKLVFVAFTGYACTNCKWMKSNMFPRPEIAGALERFVLVELYTDGTDAASEANQRLQETRFQTVAIPHYAVVGVDGNIVANFVGLTKSTEEFLAFLSAGKSGD
jgi:thiol:disulfide interchange protein DsbD